jgi:hypothetical protein
MLSETHYSIDDFNPIEFFQDYDFYEVFDEQKEYNIESFKYDYGSGMTTYKYYKHVIYDNDKKLKYIAAEDVIDEDLKNYCQCSVCTAQWYNISWLWTCRCCIGCLKSPFPQQHQIKKAKHHTKHLMTV